MLDRHTSLESFTTAEEFCATVLGDRGVPELRGWTVAMEEGDTAVELNGGKGCKTCFLVSFCTEKF